MTFFLSFKEGKTLFISTIQQNILLSLLRLEYIIIKM